jgi:hypothetical protein
MTSAQMAILEIFNRSRIRLNGILMLQAVIASPDYQASRHENDQALKELIENQFLRADQHCFVLLQKGFDTIYSGYTLDDVKSALLEHLSDRGGSTMTGEFLASKNALPGYHQTYFDEAKDQLISEGKIKVDSIMTVLIPSS